MKRVILEGCNGAWAQERYLPFLIKEAARGDIELWVVDMGDNIKLGSLQKDWQVAYRQNRAHYLNKATQRYSELSSADYIFIVTPDRFHSKIATFWLERLAHEGKIFIEKPLDAYVGSALKLKEEIEKRDKKGAVFAFDHYLARAYPFLRHSAYYLKEIGGVEEIELHILEDFGISPEREKALDKGMISDLFCHVLALVCALVNQNLSCSETKLQAIKLVEVKAARYVGCPISGDTFAWIKFMVNNDIQVVSAVGKCVNTFVDKFMRLSGPNGKIELDLRPKEGNKFSVFDSEGKQQKQGKLNAKHVESFLEGILQGKGHPFSVPGVLSFDAALEILKILDESKKQIDKMPEYPCKESISQILKRF